MPKTVMQVTAMTIEAEPQECSQPSAQEPPLRHPAGVPPQQAAACEQAGQNGEQAVQSGGQAGAQAAVAGAVTANTTTPQVQAPSEAQQLQKKKKKKKKVDQAKADGEQRAPKSTTAEDSQKKKKKKNKKKKHRNQHSEDAAEADAVAAHAAMEDMPEAGVPAATQHADSAVPESSALDGAPVADAVKLGQ